MAWMKKRLGRCWDGRGVERGERWDKEDVLLRRKMGGVAEQYVVYPYICCSVLYACAASISLLYCILTTL